jgi:hypothetical protein
MAVDADPANRELMESTTPAHRKPGWQQTHGRPTRMTSQASWKVLCHRLIGASREMPAVQRHAQALDCRQSAPPYRPDTQLGNSNG